MSEPEGRGAAWTDERGAGFATSEEGRRCLKSAPQASWKAQCEFLLVGTWPSAPAELPLAMAAQAVITRAAWHAGLRRWGLLRSFGLPAEPGAEPRVCLVVRATGEEAARRLAVGWGRVSGYRVTVLPLVSAGEGRRR